MTKLFRTLVTENPMMIEITRFRRKFFGGSASAINTVIVGLAGVIYLGLVALVWNYRESASPIMLILLQTGFFTLMAPALLYNSIAGERERRSWDFLLVAPVTQAQIIMGKFMGAATAILCAAVAFLLPIGIGVAYYQPYVGGYYGGGFDVVQRSFLANINDILEAELLSISWGLLLCAITIFFSARCRRGFIALGVTLAFVLTTVIMWPVLVSSLAMSGLEREVAYFLHPFWVLSMMFREGGGYDREMVASFDWLHGIPQILLYLGFTIAFLVWAELTVRFADNEMKFIPKRKDA
ncbi:MAG: ABC transporter permease [Armatimonadetes bacterium]|nr:ABC transporter permease [Armatimonadota bacterium]